MIWLAPGALAALALLALPVGVHLLARRNARRVIFPATHLVRATQAAAVRLRRPTDLGLLLLRLAIVTVAVFAAAQPLLLTPWRIARWNTRVSRAVIVDTSRSLADPSIADRLAGGELRDVFAGQRIDTPDLSDGIDRAARWLASASPSRREIVVVSDFQRGALSEQAVASIPDGTGVRFIRAGTPPSSRRETPPPVEGWRGGIWEATATVDATGVRASWRRRGNAGAPRWVSVTAAPADTAAAESALRAALSPGVAAGVESRRLLIRFAGAPTLEPSAQPVQTGWIADAAVALHTQELLRQVETVVTVLERDGAMIVDAQLSAASLLAPAVVRAAILSVRSASIVSPEAEIATLSDSELSRWRRDSAPVTRLAIPTADDSDWRWFWALALVFVIVEGRVRQLRARTTAREAHADAA